MKTRACFGKGWNGIACDKWCDLSSKGKKTLLEWEKNNDVQHLLFPQCFQKSIFEILHYDLLSSLCFDNLHRSNLVISFDITGDYQHFLLFPQCFKKSPWPKMHNFVVKVEHFTKRQNFNLVQFETICRRKMLPKRWTFYQKTKFQPGPIWNHLQTKNVT